MPRARPSPPARYPAPSRSGLGEGGNGCTAPPSDVAPRILSTCPPTPRAQARIRSNDTAVRDNYRLAEYTSVRAESVAARDAQQTTLQWTLAALAVLLAGILTSQIRTHDPAVYVAPRGAWSYSPAALRPFGLARPSGWSEQHCSFGVSRRSSAGPKSEKAPPEPSLRWETWRALPKGHAVRERGPWVSKASLSILGAFALYGLVAAGGLFILGAAVADTSLPRPDRHLALGLAICTAVFYAALAGYMAARH